MNKNLAYISLCFFCFFHIPFANAQSVNIRKDSGLYVSLNGGSSIPLGYFKSPTYLGSGGYAMNGYGGNIGIEHPLKPGWLGLSFEIGYYVNPFNLSAYKDIINPYLSPYSYKYYSATPYKEVPILGGIFFETIFKRFTVEFQGKAGLEIIASPYVDAAQTNITTLPIIIVPGAASFMGNQYQHSYAVFAYSLVISIRYALMKHFSMRGNAGYLNNFLSKPDLSFPTKYGKDNIPLSQLHIEIGLAYHF